MTSLDPSLEREVWFEYMDHGQQDLVHVALTLLAREEEQHSSTFHDYSFVVFPMAKAYEGFLKKYFYDLGVLDTRAYESDHFRIGKSLNPDLPEQYRDEDWVVEKLDELCPEKPLISESLWREWKESRNMLVHYFPHHERFISLEEARIRLERLVVVMRRALSCEAFVRGAEKTKR